MLTPPLAARVAVLHQEQLRAEVARDRRAEQANNAHARAERNWLHAVWPWLKRDVGRSQSARRLASA